MMNEKILDLKRSILELPEIVINNAISIYLYGSVARGDADQYSDYDLLIPIHDCSDSQYYSMKEATNRWRPELKCEFSFYQMSTLEQMRKKGSYFLWHIKTEGIQLYRKEDCFDTIMQNLLPYNGTADDFRDYGEIINDIIDSASKDDKTVIYDLSVLATIARNICIGICYLNGTLDFGRKSPVLRCIDLWQNEFPFSIDEYNELYSFRIQSLRNESLLCCDVGLEYINMWLLKIRKLHHLAMLTLR